MTASLSRNLTYYSKVPTSVDGPKCGLLVTVFNLGQLLRTSVPVFIVIHWERQTCVVCVYRSFQNLTVTSVTLCVPYQLHHLFIFPICTTWLRKICVAHYVRWHYWSYRRLEGTSLFHDAKTNLLISTHLTCRHRCRLTDDIINIFAHHGGPGSTPGSPCRFWYFFNEKCGTGRDF
jgi:hypothetical protein